MDTVIQEIAAERQRQTSKLGWTTAHDDQHSNSELAHAAACYAAPAPPGVRAASLNEPPLLWPWHRAYWKPKDQRSNLVRAAALIVAEIERLDRLRAAETPAPQITAG